MIIFPSSCIDKKPIDSARSHDAYVSCLLFIVLRRMGKKKQTAQHVAADETTDEKSVSGEIHQIVNFYLRRERTAQRI